VLRGKVGRTVTPFHILAILLTLAAGFAYVNIRTLNLPTAIGLMAKVEVLPLAD
jgi:hypothetical protein